MANRLLFCLAVAGISVIAACSDAPTATVTPVETVEILAPEDRLYGVGDTLQLDVRAFDGAGVQVRDLAVTWASADPSILSIAPNGIATSHGIGETLISATADEVIDVHRLAVVTGFVLPYPVGEAWGVVQAIGGSFTHNGSFHYAFDFRMPIGSVITAAHGGVVHFVEEQYLDGDNALGHENMVIIDHGDGTFARYLHLTVDGALVEVGDVVVQGDTLALSGNTGYSTLPHLHFDVTHGCAVPLPNCQTIPFWFRNAQPTQPNVDDRPVAEPYN